MKKSRIIVQSALAITLILITTSVVLAWEPNFPSAPYTGYMTWHLDESGRYGESGANNIKWSHYGKWYMEQYDTDPKLDMTADCSENSPQGDKLDVAYCYRPHCLNGGWPD